MFACDFMYENHYFCPLLFFLFVIVQYLFFFGKICVFFVLPVFLSKLSCVFILHFADLFTVDAFVVCVRFPLHVYYNDIVLFFL